MTKETKFQRLSMFPIFNFNGVACLLNISLLLPLLSCATAQTAAEQSPPPSELMSLAQKFNPSMAIVMIAIVSAFFFMGFFSVYLRQCIERRVRGRFNTEIVGIGGHRSWSEQLGYWEVSHFRILGGKGAQDRERGAGMRGVPKRVRRRWNAAFAPQVQSRVSLRLYRSLVGLSRHLSCLSCQPYSQTRWKILRSRTHFWAGNWIRWIGHQSRDPWDAKPSSDCRGRAVPRCNEPWPGHAESSAKIKIDKGTNHWNVPAFALHGSFADSTGWESREVYSQITGGDKKSDHEYEFKSYKELGSIAGCAELEKGIQGQ